MKNELTFSIPMETIGNFVYLGLIAAFIGVFYLFCIVMDKISKK
jgi:hypothetical protein